SAVKAARRYPARFPEEPPIMSPSVLRDARRDDGASPAIYRASEATCGYHDATEVPERPRSHGTLARAWLAIRRALGPGTTGDARWQHAHHRVHGTTRAVRRFRRGLLDH